MNENNNKNLIIVSAFKKKVRILIGTYTTLFESIRTVGELKKDPKPHIYFGKSVNHLIYFSKQHSYS